MRPAEGAVSWNVNTACNYRCSYCTQRFKEDRGRWARDTGRFLEAFRRHLLGRWEFKLSGGEPFVHPSLTELVAGLAELGHRISVVTNFSASDARLDAFIAAARGRVGVFSASLHLEYTPDPMAFARRLRRLGERLSAAADPTLPPPSVAATVVATRAVLPELPSLVARFGDEGVVLKVQPEKQARDVIPYDEAELAVLRSLGGHNLTGEVAHDFQGWPCWAGARYFILDDTGDAWRCYPARRYRLGPADGPSSEGDAAVPNGARSGNGHKGVDHLGNLLDGSFVLRSAPTPCLYKYCNCTVPITRGMMTDPSATAPDTLA